MDTGQQLREALESRARRGKPVGQAPDTFSSIQQIGGQAPSGHQDNGRVLTYTGPFTVDQIPFIGSMIT